jgi:predicted site-specific integrase-resolvase
MKLSVWAKKIGMSYRNAHRIFKLGSIKGAYQLDTGTIVVPEDVGCQKAEWTVVYARVSSSENKPNLESQADRVCQFCSAKGWVVNEIVKECASGLNDERPKLMKIFKEHRATRIVVEHKDRLTRFGFNYIKTLLTDCEIVIINEVKEDESDLMQDFVNLVTSFCARLYGRRRSKRATEKLIKRLNDDKIV